MKEDKKQQIRTGLTSVSFREKSVEDIVLLAMQAQLTGIEWGGDIHVPAGEIQRARDVGTLTRAKGLQVLSYGSYYRGTQLGDFVPVLETAKALQAPVIRIWAGEKTLEQMGEGEFRELVKNIRLAGNLAEREGIQVALEYHRNTVTETVQGACKLLEEVNHPFVKTYWQPNPELSEREHLEEIEQILPWLIAYHVFHWLPDSSRCLLEEGYSQWESYCAASYPKEMNYILEFIKEDGEENFFRDANTLHTIASSHRRKKPKAIYFCNGKDVMRVYDEKTRIALEIDFDLFPQVITGAQIKQQVEVLKEAEYVFSTWGMPELSTTEVREIFPNLKAIFYAAGSVKYFAGPYLEAGVRVFSSWAANAVPVAEQTIAHILLANKGTLPVMESYRKEGAEKAAAFAATFPGNYGVLVGILGAGMIGRLVLRLLQPFQVECMVYDPFVADEVLDELGAKRASLDTIFSKCQVISNHLADVKDTKGILDYKLFSNMKENATFINTGRGAQVVEADLIQALREVSTRTAILDVTDPEPPLQGSLLYEQSNIFISPHMAGSMGAELARMGEYMQQEARSFLLGERITYEVSNSYEVSSSMLETMA